MKPSAASRSAVFGPMPGMIRGGRSARRRHASSRPMATKPRGFSRSLATLATSRLGPMPTEIAIPVRSATSVTSSRTAGSGRGTSVRSA